MDASGRSPHQRGADDVAPPWVAGSRNAWDLVAPFTWPTEDGGGSNNSHRYAMLIAFGELMRPVARPAPGTVTGAAYVDDAYGNGWIGAVPASADAIAGLRETTAGEARERACVVCLQDFEGEDALRRLPCLHSFHERCIFDWLRVSGVCPLCRHRLPAMVSTGMEELDV